MNYSVVCYQPGCGAPALYKIAARWSDGVTAELKTYSLCCAGCLPALYQASLQRQVRTRLIEGETLERPGIYQLAKGGRDRQLVRLQALEEELNPSSPPPRPA
jgi:hypothetical protein